MAGIIKELPYCIILNSSKSRQAEAWASKHFGERWFAVSKRDGTWTRFWAGRDDPSNYRWYFKHEKDLIWFSLKWA